MFLSGQEAGPGAIGVVLMWNGLILAGKFFGTMNRALTRDESRHGYQHKCKRRHGNPAGAIQAPAMFVFEDFGCNANLKIEMYGIRL
jgi:hypothetical protein